MPCIPGQVDGSPHIPPCQHGGGGGPVVVFAKSIISVGGSENFQQSILMITQTSLAKRIGIANRHLAHVRNEHLTEFEHFEKKGRGFVYTEKGVAVISEILSGDAHAGDGVAFDGGNDSDVPKYGANVSESLTEPKKEGAEKTAAESLHQAIVDSEIGQKFDFTVTKCPRNRRIVLGRVAGREGEMRCRVADNTKLTAGVLIEGCTLIRGDYFEFAGRLPKTKKHWRQIAQQQTEKTK